MNDFPADRQQQRRRQLRRTSTEPEQLLWSALRDRRLGGLEFRRQHAIDPWIVDFVCLEKSLILEIDGGYHDKSQAEDLRRQDDLEARGFQVLRFQNEEVLTNLEGVVIAIRRHSGLADGESPSP
ncbi:endonuclease domain-containing protein [Bremerella cremea]|uniref:endonuclease domain-containing protein n=1 Tax=Bremerella cremea TaxID=1031537 RepID=UPI0031EDC879